MKKLIILFSLISLKASSQLKPDVIITPNGPNTQVYWNAKFKTLILPHNNINNLPVFQGRDTIGGIFVSTDIADIHTYIKEADGNYHALANLDDLNSGPSGNYIVNNIGVIPQVQQQATASLLNISANYYKANYAIFVGGGAGYPTPEDPNYVEININQVAVNTDGLTPTILADHSSFDFATVANAPVNDNDVVRKIDLAALASLPVDNGLLNYTSYNGLGGALNQNTNIELGTYILNFTGAGQTHFNISSGGFSGQANAANQYAGTYFGVNGGADNSTTNITLQTNYSAGRGQGNFYKGITIDQTGIVITNQRTNQTFDTGDGMHYAADYSAYFTARSLIDKGYADSHYGSGGGSGTGISYLRLTGTGTGSATISIPHGLTGISASSIVIVKEANSASSGNFSVTADATNINFIYTSSAPASGASLSYNVTIKQ